MKSNNICLTFGALKIPRLLTQEGTKLPAGTHPGCYNSRLRGGGIWFEEGDDSIRFGQKGRFLMDKEIKLSLHLCLPQAHAPMIISLLESCVLK